MTLHDDLLAMGRAARAAAESLRSASAEQRTAAIRGMARGLRENAVHILEENAKDVAAATSHIDRLMLDEDRVEAMAAAIDLVAGIPDPVGQEMARWIAIALRNASEPDRRIMA